MTNDQNPMTKSQRGFTILETVVAIFIVSVSLVLILDTFTVSATGGARAGNLSFALNLAQERIEEIKNIAAGGTILQEGTGTNPADAFLPALNKVSVIAYPANLYLTESNYYQVHYGTSASLSGMNPARRIDRITQLEWIDDPDDGSNQDYLKVTVTVFWSEGNKTTSAALVSYVYQ
jgi:prepilin-type N-terminal cleavage/methylation domain-containing protein